MFLNSLYHCTAKSTIIRLIHHQSKLYDNLDPNSKKNVKLYEYCDIFMFVSRMVTVMSNCMNTVIFLCLYPGSKLYDNLDPNSKKNVKLYEYCEIFMFVSRMVTVMSNCMNTVIFLCLYPGWSQWCQTVWILWYSYVCIQDGLSVMSNCMNIVIFLCLYPGWSLSDFKLYEYRDILMFVSRMVPLWCQTVWILWYSYVCIQDGLSVMSNCMNIVVFLCLYPGWSQWCQTVWILWYSYVCIQDGLSVMSNCMNTVIFLCLCPGWSLWCQTVWILWYSYVCVQDGLSVMSNCMNTVIFLCLYPGWSQWCQTVWILWYSYVFIQDGLSVMSNCMNIVIFLCLYPGWSLSDFKLYEYRDILMFVSRMVSLWCQTVWILWYSYVCIQDGLSVMSNCMNIVIFLCLYPRWSLCDVKLHEYCDILMFASWMVSQWCQTVWILWYSYVCIQDGLSVMSNCMNIVVSYVCIQDGLSVMSNCMNIVIFLCLCPGWSNIDVKLYEYCDILKFVSRMVSLWCQTVWILWYSYVCVQDGITLMSNCMNIVIFLSMCPGWSLCDVKNIVIFLSLCPGWSLCDVKLYEYCDILMFVSRMVSQWCQTVWILWYSYVCIQDGLSVMTNCINIVIFLCLYPGCLSVMSNCMNIVIFLYLYPGWSLSNVKLYEYCDIIMFVSRIVSQWCQTVWILWYSYVCIQDGLSVMSNWMNIVIFLCLCPRWSLCDVKLYEYCDILMFVSRMVSQWCQTVWILWHSYVCAQDGPPVMSNCMNIVVFLCLCPWWSPSDVNCMNIVIFLCLFPGWSPSDVKLYENCDNLMFVSWMVSLWCQTVWILWYSYVCMKDGLSVISNCMNIVIFLCLYLGWSLSDFKLYEYCDILKFVSRMVAQWCQTVWILWYSYVCIQDGLSVMSNCMNIVIFLCLYPRWSLCDVKLYEYCDILMFVYRMVPQWCQTVWILWYSYVCVQDGLSVMSNCMNIVIFLSLCPGWSLSGVKLYEYCDILMFVSRMVSL